MTMVFPVKLAPLATWWLHSAPIQASPTRNLFIYVYFDRITYIISKDVQINTIVFTKVLWSVKY